MKSKRISFSKKTRFEIFKRDNFTCQYCGRIAPEVILEIDHIKPLFENGSNDYLNLITACKECNSGKGKIKLNDDTELKKQNKELKLLMEKNEQLEMLLKYRGELEKLNTKEIDILCNEFLLKTNNKHSVSDNGKLIISRLIKKYGLAKCLEALDTAFDVYYKENNSENTIEVTFSKIESILVNHKRFKENPILTEFYYCRGILKNRLQYYDKWLSLKLIEKAYEKINDIGKIKKICIECKNWTVFRQTMEGIIGIKNEL